MSPPTLSPSGEQVVRVSFIWILVGIIGVVLLSFTGGIAAQQFFRTPVPLRNDPNQIVNTVQEVTISPNTASAQVVERTNRSVVLLGRGEASAATMIGTGVVLTNDGVLVSTIDPSGDIQAFDHEGRALPLERIGRDNLFGLTYFRITSNVVVPLDLRSTDSPVGNELLMFSRSGTTFLPRVSTIRINEYILPTATTSLGLQRLLRSSSGGLDDVSAGSPLLDEEGKVAALLQVPSQGIAIPVSALASSFQRITNNQRELDPFTNLGLNLIYTFKTVRAADGVRFVAEVANVTGNSPAAIAGVQRGDLLLSIQEEPIDWQRAIVPQLSHTLPLTLHILRKNEEKTFTLQAQPSPLAPS